jgi:hypothetical protein
MPLSVTCKMCGTTFTAPHKAAGQKVRCEVCGQPVRVKTETGATLPPRQASTGRGTARKSGRRTKAGTPPWLKGAAIGAVVLLVAGGIGASVWHFVGGEGGERRADGQDHTDGGLISTSSGGPSFRSYFTELLDTRQETLEQLKGVTDVASAEAAQQEIVKHVEKLRQLATDVQAHFTSDRETRNEMRSANDELAGRWTTTVARLQDEWARVREIPGVSDVLQSTINDANRASSSFDAARRKYVGSGGVKATTPSSDPNAVVAGSAPATSGSTPAGLTPNEAAALEEINKSTEFPRDQWIMVRLDVTQFGLVPQVHKRMREILGRSAVSRLKGDVFYLAPVPNLDVFVNEIDFGKVVERDDVVRRLLIEVDPDYIYLPPELRPPQ